MGSDYKWNVPYLLEQSTCVPVGNSEGGNTSYYRHDRVTIV